MRTELMKKILTELDKNVSKEESPLRGMEVNEQKGRKQNTESKQRWRKEKSNIDENKRQKIKNLDKNRQISGLLTRQDILANMCGQATAPCSTPFLSSENTPIVPGSNTIQKVNIGDNIPSSSDTLDSTKVSRSSGGMSSSMNNIDSEETDSTEDSGVSSNPCQCFTNFFRLLLIFFCSFNIYNIKYLKGFPDVRSYDSPFLDWNVGTL